MDAPVAAGENDASRLYFPPPFNATGKALGGGRRRSPVDKESGNKVKKQRIS
jgi:hypothetical protein